MTLHNNYLEPKQDVIPLYGTNRHLIDAKNNTVILFAHKFAKPTVINPTELELKKQNTDSGIPLPESYAWLNIVKNSETNPVSKVREQKQDDLARQPSRRSSVASAVPVQSIPLNGNRRKSSSMTIELPSPGSSSHTSDYFIPTRLTTPTSMSVDTVPRTPSPMNVVDSPTAMEIVDSPVPRRKGTKRRGQFEELRRSARLKTRNDAVQPRAVAVGAVIERVSKKRNRISPLENERRQRARVSSGQQAIPQVEPVTRQISPAFSQPRSNFPSEEQRARSVGTFHSAGRTRFGIDTQLVRVQPRSAVVAVRSSPVSSRRPSVPLITNGVASPLAIEAPPARLMIEPAPPRRRRKRQGDEMAEQALVPISPSARGLRRLARNVKRRV